MAPKSTAPALFVAGLLLAGATGLGAQAGAAPSVQPSRGALAGAKRVSMKDFAFAPATLTLHAGQAVVWTYDESASDPMPNCETVALQIPGSPLRCPGHSTSSDTPGLWDSGVRRADGFPYSVRFLTPGTYTYHCTVHGGRNPNNPLTHMNGTIVVLAAAAAPTPAVQPTPTPTPTPSPGAATSPTALPVTGQLPSRSTGLALVTVAVVIAIARRVTPVRGRQETRR